MLLECYRIDSGLENSILVSQPNTSTIYYFYTMKNALSGVQID